MPGKQAGKGKGFLGLSPRRAKPGLESPATKEAVRGIRQRKRLTIPEASRAGEVGWAEGEEGRPVSGLQLPSPGAPGPLPRQEPRTPIRLLPEAKSNWGCQRRGWRWGLRSDPLGICVVGEQLPLVIQEELSEGVDGIDGLESDGGILGPQQVRAKDDGQVSVGHLVLVRVGRDLRKQTGSS